jgi:hypothetical protein
MRLDSSLLLLLFVYFCLFEVLIVA